MVSNRCDLQADNIDMSCTISETRVSQRPAAANGEGSNTCAGMWDDLFEGDGMRKVLGKGKYSNRKGQDGR